MNNIKTFHDEKIKSIAQELSDKGYTVAIEPSRTKLPFDLGGYIPDLIATKNGQGIIIEAKSNTKKISIDRFQNLAKRVASHPGWRFILVPIENKNEEIYCDVLNNFPSWEELKSQLSNIKTLIEQSQILPAILFFWSVFEASLRKRAIEQNLPIDKFSPLNLLNHAFSSGEISLSEFDLFKDIFSLRNKTAHGIVMSVTSAELEIFKQANDSLNNLLSQWCFNNDD